MVQLHQDLEQFEQAGLQIVGVSYDKVDILKSCADKNKITFPLLSDEGSKVINAYKIHNRRGLPHPGTFLIDQSGVIRDKIFLDGYRKRHSNADLLEAAKAIQVDSSAANR